MGFLSNLLSSILSKKQKTNDLYTSEIKRCMIEVKLTKGEYRLFALNYYKGSTSYRDFFLNVFFRKQDKIRKIVAEAEKKAKNGCVIDFTYVRFIYDRSRYIDIPFEVFTQKKNMPDRKRRTKVWHRENIKRILANNPDLKNIDTYDIEDE